MEEKKESPSQATAPPPYYYQPPMAPPEDEISLLDLWQVLVRQWKWISGLTVFAVAAAIVYLLTAPPVYEAQAIVRPPDSKYVEALSVPGISQISNADIFAQFTANLRNSFLRQQFIAENPQLSSLHRQFTNKTQQFLRDEVPRVKAGQKNEEGLFFLSLQGYDGKLVAEWLNGYILLVETKTIEDLLSGVEAKIANQKKEIEIQLQTGAEFASQRRLDRIALLEEQIAIARAANIFERKISDHAKVADQSIGLTVTMAEDPLYMRGVKELTAEKEGLEKRKNDEPFIAGFRDKQERLAQLAAGLQRLQETRATVRAVTVEQPAVETKKPVKPRRMLVLALSLALGGMIGIFAAFFREFLAKARRPEQ